MICLSLTKFQLIQLFQISQMPKFACYADTVACQKLLHIAVSSMKPKIISKIIRLEHWATNQILCRSAAAASNVRIEAAGQPRQKRRGQAGKGRSSKNRVVKLGGLGAKGGKSGSPCKKKSKQCSRQATPVKITRHSLGWYFVLSLYSWPTVSLFLASSISMHTT